MLSRFIEARKSDPKKQLRVGILGGSVSACHAVAPLGETMVKGCYGRDFGDWLSARFGGDAVTVQNSAIGGMDSR